MLPATGAGPVVGGGAGAVVLLMGGVAARPAAGARARAGGFLLLGFFEHLCGGWAAVAPLGKCRAPRGQEHCQQQ